MELNLLVAVTDRKKSRDFTAMMRKNGLSTILTLGGHGTASKDVLGILGIEGGEKVLLLSAANRLRTAAVMRDARNKLYVDIPGNGIIAAVPIRSIGGTKTLHYLTNDRTVTKSVPEIKFDAEMIFVILNSGFTEEVMDAARTAGAGGGTVIEAKGTGAKLAHKFLGITIAEDKQIVLIVTRTADRSAIIDAIMHQCGPGTEAGAVAFSVPATQIAGLRLVDDEIPFAQEANEESEEAVESAEEIVREAGFEGDAFTDVSETHGDTEPESTAEIITSAKNDGKNENNISDGDNAEYGNNPVVDHSKTDDSEGNDGDITAHGEGDGI